MKRIDRSIRLFLVRNVTSDILGIHMRSLKIALVMCFATLLPPPGGATIIPGAVEWKIPLEEPEPTSTEVLEFGPVPTQEPPPEGTQDEPLQRKDRLPAGGLFGSCGNGGSGLRSGFNVQGHAFSLRWIERTLHGVIANRCQSKTYQDILPLDGGTVGISHFASGSLYTLYQQMDTSRYFGKHAHRVPAKPYHHGWWRQGMRRFVQTPEAKGAQQRAWRAYISPALAAALSHEWQSDRELAIAASVANSLGAYGFQRLAERNAWDAERTLISYASRSSHKERRRLRLNLEFPY